MENNPLKDQEDSSKKFYSRNMISFASYLGGPLAAGVLVRQNFINEGKEEYGKHALFIGIISTIVLIVGIFSIPEHILEEIPNPLIPAIYTLIIYLLVERLQGKTLNEHKENDGKFYSGWKAAGIALLCGVLMVGGSFAYVHFNSEDAIIEEYDAKMAEFIENEKQALELFTILESDQFNRVNSFIRETGLPAWKKNLMLVNELDEIEGIYGELQEHNRKLHEYCELRIESYKLILKAIEEDTDDDIYRLEEINTRIEELLEVSEGM